MSEGYYRNCKCCGTRLEDYQQRRGLCSPCYGYAEGPERPLKAFCNGYETIAAHAEDEARDILRSLDMYDDEEDLDGDGWSVLKDEDQLRDEDGKLKEETVGGAVIALGKPGHLWSCEV